LLLAARLKVTPFLITGITAATTVIRSGPVSRDALLRAAREIAAEVMASQGAPPFIKNQVLEEFFRLINIAASAIDPPVQDILYSPLGAQEAGNVDSAQLVVGLPATLPTGLCARRCPIGVDYREWRNSCVVEH
jgi:hypothetical protein